jgi:predicted GIY-YIG superfamily endonuclease
LKRSKKRRLPRRSASEDGHCDFNSCRAFQSYDSARQRRKGVMSFYYVYILQSQPQPDHFYVGFTEDLESRLKAHNQSECPHSTKYKPWKIKTAVAFSDRQKALDFERYLKTASGRAFVKKRL